MKNEITEQVRKRETFVAVSNRSDKYALKRNVQAQEFNDAIIARQLMESKIQVKCEKCGKEFTAGLSGKESIVCPDCK